MIRFVVFMLVIGGVLGFWGFQEWKLSRVASATPQEITAEELAKNGPGKNAHVVLSTYVLGDNFIYKGRKNGTTWEEVWIPVIPLTPALLKKLADMKDDAAKLPEEILNPKNLSVIIKCKSIRNQSDLNSFPQFPRTCRGLVINEIESIGAEENRLLTQSYPGTDFKKCWIVEVDREPAGAGKIYGLIGAGLALIVVGIVVPLAARSGNNRDPE